MNNFPSEHSGDARRLNVMWYGMLPGAIVIMMAALYAWTRSSSYAPPVIDEMLVEYLPLVFGAAIMFGAGLALFLKSRLPALVARSPSPQPFQRASTAAFIVLGAADAPALIGIGIFLMNPAEWLAAATILYAFAAGIFFKPDFGVLLSSTGGTKAGNGVEPG